MDNRLPAERRFGETPGELAAILRGPALGVSARVSHLKAELEQWVEAHPDDYGGLVLLGELNLRTGLKPAARTLLYRASLLKPPSWEAYQRTSLLLRRAEAEQSLELERVAGAPPPRWVRQAAANVVALLKTTWPGRGQSYRDVPA